MKYYQELSRLGAFTTEDASRIMTNISNVSKKLSAMQKKGLVKRIKHNLYACVDLINGDVVATRFVIATHINDNSFVSFHSAFEFYGFYNQVYYDVQVSTDKRFAGFESDSNYYRCFLSETNAQVEEYKGVKVTSIERTIIDSIDMLGKVMDVEELIKCLQLVHNVSQEKLIEILRVYNKEILYRKAGYILSYFKEQFDLDDKFFEFCRENSNFSNRGSISYNELNNLTFVKEWSLYGYGNLMSLVDKGGETDV